MCEGTVEERIAQLIDDKQALADVVVGQGEAWLTELTTAQLQDLVRLDAVGAGARCRRATNAADAATGEHGPSRASAPSPGRLPATLLRALCAELADPARYRRAKDYARDGAVIDLDVRPGAVVGEVLGSRRDAVPGDARGRSRRRRRHGAPARVMLIPERTELAVACTCPDADSGAMCKHALALLLVLADEVSIEPELLARWRSAGRLGADRRRAAPRSGGDRATHATRPGRDRGGGRSPAPVRVDVLAQLLASPTPIGDLGPMAPLAPEALLTPPARADAMSVGARSRPRRRRGHGPPRRPDRPRRAQARFRSRQ